MITNKHRMGETLSNRKTSVNPKSSHHKAGKQLIFVSKMFLLSKASKVKGAKLQLYTKWLLLLPKPKQDPVWKTYENPVNSGNPPAIHRIKPTGKSKSPSDLDHPKKGIHGPMQCVEI